MILPCLPTEVCPYLSVSTSGTTPGFVATDLNGHSGELTVEQGATVPVTAAMLPDDGPTGRFFSQYGEAPW